MCVGAIISAQKKDAEWRSKCRGYQEMKEWWLPLTKEFIPTPLIHPPITSTTSWPRCTSSLPFSYHFSYVYRCILGGFRWMKLAQKNAAGASFQTKALFTLLNWAMRELYTHPSLSLGFPGTYLIWCLGGLRCPEKNHQTQSTEMIDWLKESQLNKSLWKQWMMNPNHWII